MAYIELKSVVRPTAPPQDWSILPRRISYACWLFAGILGVLAAAMAYGQYQKMSSWIPAEATVTANEVYWDNARDAKGKASVVYGARFQFTYVVDGREQVGIADLGYKSSLRGWIEKQARTLPVGTRRMVRVNPDNPAELSLASDFGQLSFASSYFAFGVSIVIFSLGLGLWWWSLQLVESRQNKLTFADAR